VLEGCPHSIVKLDPAKLDCTQHTKKKRPGYIHLEKLLGDKIHSLRYDMMWTSQ
jgi:hypothetical protein